MTSARGARQDRSSVPRGAATIDKSRGWKKRLVLQLLDEHPDWTHRQVAEEFGRLSGEMTTEHLVAKIKYLEKTRTGGEGKKEEFLFPAELAVGTVSPELSFEEFLRFKYEIKRQGLDTKTVTELVSSLRPLVNLAGSWDALNLFVDAMM